MKCEKTVLCETSQDAQHAIHAPNVNAVYTVDGSKRYKKFSTLVSLHFFLSNLLPCSGKLGSTNRLCRHALAREQGQIHCTTSACCCSTLLVS